MAASQGEAPDPDERPDFINDTGAFQMGKDGPYANLALPAADLGKAPTNLDSILKLLSSVNPIIKAPIEAATNNQWFTGREIEGYEGEKRDAPFAGLIKAITGQDVPGIDRRTTGHALDQIPLLRNLDAISNPDNERQMSRLSTFLGGPGVYQEENVARSLSYEQKQMLTDLLRKMKDEGQEVPSLKELKEMGIIE